MVRKNKRLFLLAIFSMLFVVLIIVILSSGFVSSMPIFFAPTPTPSPLPTLAILPYGAADLSETDYVNKAKEALADKLKIGVSEINLVNAEKREWSDTSLGCPEGGRFYSQVITPGYLIVLSVQGGSFTYHVGNGRVVSCEN